MSGTFEIPYSNVSIQTLLFNIPTVKTSPLKKNTSNKNSDLIECVKDFKWEIQMRTNKSLIQKMNSKEDLFKALFYNKFFNQDRII